MGGRTLRDVVWAELAQLAAVMHCTALYCIVLYCTALGHMLGTCVNSGCRSARRSSSRKQRAICSERVANTAWQGGSSGVDGSRSGGSQ